MGYEYQNAVFLAKSQKRFSNESRNNLIFSAFSHIAIIIKYPPMRRLADVIIF